jgi:hypothetical protein
MNEQPAVNQICTHLVSNRAACVRGRRYCREGWNQDPGTEFKSEQQQQQ